MPTQNREGLPLGFAGMLGAPPSGRLPWGSSGDIVPNPRDNYRLAQYCVPRIAHLLDLRSPSVRHDKGVRAEESLGASGEALVQGLQDR